MKKKHIAGILALLFGIFGVHRFYLGQKKKGILYLGLFFIGLLLAINPPYFDEPPLMIFPAIIGFIDAILFFVMPQKEFNYKYNAGQVWNSQQDFANYQEDILPNTANNPKNLYKQRGLESFRNYDYDSAIRSFQKALDFNYKDPAVHFNLACCYSINEQAENAFFHLDKSVDFGFTTFKKIHNHDALAFLRSHEEFEAFVQNQYQMSNTLLGPKEDLLSTTPTKDKDALEKIASLGELRDKGFLTDDEFSMQKRRLLRDE